MIIYDENDKILSNIARVVRKRLPENTDVELRIDKSMDEMDSEIKNGVISAGAYGQLLDAAGRFLRNPKVSGKFHSYKTISGMYFASHNSNYYVSAPLEEIYEYIEDLALWGMNTMRMWFDLFYYKNMADGKEFADRMKAMIKYAKSIGVKICLSIISNEAFHVSPKELRADWTGGHDGYIKNLNDHYHVEICPSKPGGIEKILEYRRDWLETFKDAAPDMIDIGPYDEGGCTCPDCAPWGANGYVRCCEALAKLVKEYFPEAELNLSLWMFGVFTGNNIEFEKLSEILATDRLKDFKYVGTDPYYQSYAYEIDMHRPLMARFEISMCDTVPWGGYGTNPIPKRIMEKWAPYSDKNIGGCPYSEGFYEDINKVISLRLYRDNQDPEITIREYLSYEFGFKGEMLEKVADAIINMEETLYRDFVEGHRYLVHNPEKIPAIEKTIIEADATLPENIRNKKRWQLIYLRAIIDGELYRNDFTRNDKVMECFRKIIEIGYLDNASFYIKPDVIVDSDYGKEVLSIPEIMRIVWGKKPDLGDEFKEDYYD